MTQAVAGLYDSNPVAEWERLDASYPRIEFLSTLYLIDKYLPKQGHLADIGGGPGRYAIEMLKRGHAVTLTDLSAACIDLAHTKLKEAGLKADQMLCGDARELSPLRSASFDAALMLGPLYHLLDATDRAICLRELHRIIKPGGTAIIAYINALGMYRTGLTDFPAFFENPGILPLMLERWGPRHLVLRQPPSRRWTR
ncbi:MAG: class I SAM-dependent methyltransferase [Dehalococcoidia bacterium]|nr:class I SAM-dependent methyltransferase [Dehalococcoidia bacterium]